MPLRFINFEMAWTMNPPTDVTKMYSDEIVPTFSLLMLDYPSLNHAHKPRYYLLSLLDNVALPEGIL